MIINEYLLGLYIYCHGVLSTTLGFMKFYKKQLSGR